MTFIEAWVHQIEVEEASWHIVIESTNVVTASAASEKEQTRVLPLGGLWCKNSTDQTDARVQRRCHRVFVLGNCSPSSGAELHSPLHIF